jgi:YHS domain-containing protein
MKNTLAVLLSGLMFLGGFHAAAQEAQVPAAETTQEAAAEVPASVKVGNKICPVSGMPVGSMGEGAEIEYHGKIYHLCCLGCDRDFNKDPEKFSKKAEDEVAAAAAADEAADTQATQ